MLNWKGLFVWLDGPEPKVNVDDAVGIVGASMSWSALFAPFPKWKS